jgi:hypothetical protein
MPRGPLMTTDEPSDSQLQPTAEQTAANTLDTTELPPPPKMHNPGFIILILLLLLTDNDGNRGCSKAMKGPEGKALDL